MDPYLMRLAVFSVDDTLAQRLQSVQPPKDCVVETVHSSKPDPDLAKSCRVLVWDLPGTSLHEARDLCGPKTKLIFCSDAQTLNSLSAQEAEQADLLWPLPLIPTMALLDLRQLLNSIQSEHLLHLVVQCMDTAMDSIPDMFWFKDMEGIHVRVNQGFCAVVGKSKEDVTGKDHYYIWDVSPDDPNSGAESCQESEDAVIAAGHTLQFREQVKSPSGMRQLTVYKSPLYDEDGTPLGTVGIGRDVTSLENMTAEIDILLSGMPYAVLLRDEHGRIFDANKKFEEDFDTEKEDIIGRSYDQWAEEAFFPGRSENSEGFLEGDTRTGKRMELRKDNIYDIFNQVVGQVCIFRDVTLVRQMEAQISQHANTDFMTGLNNRRALYLHLHQNCMGNPIGLFYLDLDHFKSINDVYGHDAGDEALILTARLLEENCPHDFIARMGGDEFLIVKQGSIPMEELESQAQDLLQNLRAAYQARPNFAKLSASVGIARCESLSGDVEDLIRHSDTALYQAKEGGRAQYRVFLDA